MNNRQAGAFREMIRKEEKSREHWLRNNGKMFGLVAGPDGEPVPDPQAQIQAAPRQMEVPYVRQVKVPVKTQRMVPVRVQKKVPTKRRVEIPTFKEVEETYTTIEEKPAVRKKEIWVKKVVPERYIKRVEVPRTRKVRVPHKIVQEVDDFEVVDVMEERPMEVEGYRVDDIVSTRVVNEEEYNRMGGSRGLQPGTRRLGDMVYHPDDDRVQNIPVDSYHPSRSQSRAGLTGSQIIGGGRSGSRQQSGSRQGSAKKKKPVNSFRGTRTMIPPAKTGMRLGEVKTQDYTGCQVLRVEGGGAADRAGVRAKDVITYVNNRPCRNMSEFKAIASTINGPLYLQVVRKGAGKLKITIYR